MTSEMRTPGGSDARRRLEAEQGRLATLRDGLRRGLRDETESASLGELSDADQHPADTGTETFNRERDMGTLESIDSELSEVQAALERLEAGTYGVCEACSRAIPAERLESLPATRFCVEDAELASAEAAPGIAPVGPSREDRLEEPGRTI